MPTIVLENGSANGVIMVTVSSQPDGATVPTLSDITLDGDGKGTLTIGDEVGLIDGTWVFSFNDGSKTVDYTIIIDNQGTQEPSVQINVEGKELSGESSEINQGLVFTLPEAEKGATVDFNIFAGGVGLLTTSQSAINLCDHWSS